MMRLAKLNKYAPDNFWGTASMIFTSLLADCNFRYKVDRVYAVVGLVSFRIYRYIVI